MNLYLNLPADERKPMKRSEDCFHLLCARPHALRLFWTKYWETFKKASAAAGCLDLFNTSGLRAHPEVSPSQVSESRGFTVNRKVGASVCGEPPSGRLELPIL